MSDNFEMVKLEGFAVPRAYYDMAEKFILENCYGSKKQQKEEDYYIRYQCLDCGQLLTGTSYALHDASHSITTIRVQKQELSQFLDWKCPYCGGNGYQGEFTSQEAINAHLKVMHSGQYDHLLKKE